MASKLYDENKMKSFLSTLSLDEIKYGYLNLKLVEFQPSKFFKTYTFKYEVIPTSDEYIILWETLNVFVHSKIYTFFKAASIWEEIYIVFSLGDFKYIHTPNPLLSTSLERRILGILDSVETFSIVDKVFSVENCEGEFKEPYINGIELKISFKTRYYNDVDSIEPLEIEELSPIINEIRKYTKAEISITLLPHYH
jgi:hypothetical protein